MQRKKTSIFFLVLAVVILNRVVDAEKQSLFRGAYQQPVLQASSQNLPTVNKYNWRPGMNTVKETKNENVSPVGTQSNSFGGNLIAKAPTPQTDTRQANNSQVETPRPPPSYSNSIKDTSKSQNSVIQTHIQSNNGQPSFPQALNPQSYNPQLSAPQMEKQLTNSSIKTPQSNTIGFNVPMPSNAQPGTLQSNNTQENSLQLKVSNDTISGKADDHVNTLPNNDQNVNPNQTAQTTIVDYPKVQSTPTQLPFFKRGYQNHEAFDEAQLPHIDKDLNLTVTQTTVNQNIIPQSNNIDESKPHQDIAQQNQLIYSTSSLDANNNTNQSNLSQDDIVADQSAFSSNASDVNPPLNQDPSFTKSNVSEETTDSGANINPSAGNNLNDITANISNANSEVNLKNQSDGNVYQTLKEIETKISMNLQSKESESHDRQTPGVLSSIFTIATEVKGKTDITDFKPTKIFFGQDRFNPELSLGVRSESQEKFLLSARNLIQDQKKRAGLFRSNMKANLAA